MNKGYLLNKSHWYTLWEVEIQDSPEEGIFKITDKGKEEAGEILNIYSETISSNGQIIYKRSGEMQRVEAHNIGALHAGAHIWVYNSKWQILLQKRAKGIVSWWLLDVSVAWHILGGETVISGGIRELWQEIGLIRNPEDLVLIWYYRKETIKETEEGIRHNNEIIKVFLLRYDGDIEDLILQKSEVEKVKFISLKKLKKKWKNRKALTKYTTKSDEYLNMVLSNIKKVLWAPQ